MIKLSLGDLLTKLPSLEYGTIYFPKVEKYNADTPCVVSHINDENPNLVDHNWIDMFVLLDVYDDSPSKTKAALIKEFNKELEKDGFLDINLNFKDEIKKGKGIISELTN